MPSLARVLRAHGYRTGISGKWHVGRPRHEMGSPELKEDDDPDDPEVDAKLRRYQARLQEKVENLNILWADIRRGRRGARAWLREDYRSIMTRLGSPGLTVNPTL